MDKTFVSVYARMRSQVYAVISIKACDGPWHSRRSDCPVSLQSRRVPDLGLDGEAAELHRSRTELHPDGGAGVVVEVVLGESRQQVALSHTRFTYQNHWKGHKPHSHFN